MRWLKVKQTGWTVEEDRWRRRISVAPSRGPKVKAIAESKEITDE